MNYKNQINDPKNPYKLYVISANEIDLRTCVVNNDTKNHLCYIVSDGRNMYDMFNENTVVKVCVKYNDNTSEIYDNQMALRIIEKKLYTANENNIIVLKSLLVLDSEIDIEYIDSLNNNNIYSYDGQIIDSTVYYNKYASHSTNIILKPLHQQGVVYSLRVISDAVEDSVRYYNNEYYTMTASFDYLSEQLLFDSYFDDSYAMRIYDYDPRDLDNIWFDYVDYKNMMETISENNTRFIEDGEDSKLYVYRNHPVSITQDRYVIVKAGDIKQLDKSFKTDWKWYSYMIEDTTNWKNQTHNMSKTLMFNATNDILTVRPNMLGPQSIEMRCIDKYGNIISNTGGGNIFIR